MSFTNPIVAGTGLVREAINSPNYVAGVSGWSINRDGSAEFSDVAARGSIRSGSILLDDDAVSVGSRAPGTRGIAITTDIPPDLASHYAGEGITITTAILYYSDQPNLYFYEASTGLVRVRGLLFVGGGGVTEYGREFVGMIPPMQLRERYQVGATAPGYTPTTITPTLIDGTETIVPTAGYDPLVISWECHYTADFEQVSGSNTTTEVELYVDGAPVVGHKKLIFNPGNTSVTAPRHRVGGLSATACGTLAISAIPSSFGLYGNRALGAGTNRINPDHTGYTLKLYY